MADYFSQTVVQPAIPNGCITPLERWLLEQMFQCEGYADERTYFFASESIKDQIDRSDGVLDALLGADASPLAAALREALRTADDPDWLDVGDIGYAAVLQAIVARHPIEVPYVTVEVAYTCSRMRPDGFGGAAELITAAGSQWMGTGAWLESRIAEAASSGIIPEAPVGAREDRPTVMERERGGEDS